jgi:hypothetical protein
MLKNRFILTLFLGACAAENTSRIGFCDESGNLVDDVFIDLEKKSFVFGDTFEIGSTDCKTKNNFCFHAGAVDIEFPRSGETFVTERNIQKWGSFNWVVNYDKKTLTLEVNREGSNNDIFHSCRNSDLIFELPKQVQ